MTRTISLLLLVALAFGLSPPARSADGAAQCARAETARTAGDHKQAAKQFAKCARDDRLDPAARALAWRNAGKAYFAYYDRRAAKAAYTEAIALAPADVALDHYARGLLLRDDMNYDAARADFDRAIALQADFADAYDQRAGLRRRAGDMEGALDDDTQAWRLGKRDGFNARQLRDAGRLVDPVLREPVQFERSGEARYKCMIGTTRVHVTVGPDGVPGTIRSALFGDVPADVEAAARAARYEPARLQGEPTSGELDVPVRYRTPCPPGEAVLESEPPRYPPAALRNCAEGVVRLKVSFGAGGVILAVTLAGSSGSADLDRAALDAARKWKITPGVVDGKERTGAIIVPVTFDDPCE